MNTKLELYQLVTPLAGLGIWERNLATGECFWNQTVRELLEVPQDYAATQAEALQFYKQPETVRALIETAAHTGEPQVMEAEIVTAGGRKRWLKLRVAARGPADARISFGTLEDVTGEVMLRRTLEEREAVISRQNKRLLDFAYIVSHNLRSHGGNIQLLTQLVQEETDAAEQAGMLRLLHSNAGSLMETLGHLHELTQVQRAEVETQLLYLEAELLRVRGILSASLKEAGAVMHIEVTEGLTLNTAPAYLESILLNLISNAVKYRSPARGLIVTVSGQAVKGQLMIKVTDNGLGIDLEKHGKNLFGLYKTFHQHTDARGIGLFLVRSQVEAMGGQISVSSEPGSGSCFTITLPAPPLISRTGGARKGP